jgi:hypothetical protein
MWIMAWLVFAYVALALVTGIKGMIYGEIASGLAGALAPILTLIAGGGILSAKRGIPSMTIGSLVVGFLMFAGGCFWLWFVDWEVRLNSIALPGHIFGIVGFALGLGFGLTGRNEDRI